MWWGEVFHRKANRMKEGSSLFNPRLKGTAGSCDNSNAQTFLDQKRERERETETERQAERKRSRERIAPAPE